MDTGLIINGVAVAYADMLRCSFTGNNPQIITASFRAKLPSVGHQMISSKPASQTTIQIFSEGQLIYEKTGFQDVIFEVIRNNMTGDMFFVEQIQLIGATIVQ